MKEERRTSFFANKRETNFEAYELAKAATTLASPHLVELSSTPDIMHVNDIIDSIVALVLYSG